VRKILAILIVLAMVFPLAACGGNSNNAATSTETDVAEDVSQDSEPEPTGEPIKIGHICDLTGVEAMTGEVAKRALEFAVADTLGGQIAGRPVEIIIGDAQGQPSVAVDVARKMVEQDGVVAIFGPTQIGQKSGVAEYINTVGIPLFFYNATPTGLLASNDWLVGAGGATPQLPSVMADYLYNDLGYRKVHTLAMDNTGGRSYIDPFVEVFEALGGTVVSQQWSPVPCPDFGPYLVTLSDADALVAWVSSSDALALWTAWYEMGINEKMPIVASMHGGFTDYYVTDALAASNPAITDAMLGTYAPITYVYDLDIPENNELVENWTKTYGSVPPGNNLAGSCTEAILVLKAAVEALDGDTDPAKLIDAIFAADVNGPEGHLFFDNSRAATKDIYVVKVAQLGDGSFNYERVKTYKDVPPNGVVVD
jgi:ABC-type branched-subunit amino acid transport system substrate-binding protein